MTLLSPEERVERQRETVAEHVRAEQERVARRSESTRRPAAGRTHPPDAPLGGPAAPYLSRLRIWLTVVLEIPSSLAMARWDIPPSFDKRTTSAECLSEGRKPGLLPNVRPRAFAAAIPLLTRSLRR